MQVVHFGKILFNLQFLSLAIMLASVLTFILPAIYYLFLTCIMLMTLFIAFANPKFVSLWSGGETLTKVAEFFAGSWKFTVPIVAILSIASIICLSFDKNTKHVARIAVSVILFILAAIVLFFKLVNSGVL